MGVKNSNPHSYISIPDFLWIQSEGVIAGIGNGGIRCTGTFDLYVTPGEAEGSGNAPDKRAQSIGSHGGPERNTYRESRWFQGLNSYEPTGIVGKVPCNRLCLAALPDFSAVGGGERNAWPCHVERCNGCLRSIHRYCGRCTRTGSIP